MNGTATAPIGPAVAALWRREVVRFLRQRSRVVGALATPIVFWFLLGSGLGRSFRSAAAPDHGYLQFFYPGTLVMILLFSAIFSTISVIEDRADGFLQGVLIAPVSRSALVLGNVLGGTTLALGQAVLLLAAAPLVGFSLSAGQWLLTITVMALSAFGLTCLGFTVAWRMSSTQGFHAIMNLLLIPMWMLSGAVFPADGAPRWLQWVIAINPVSYGVASIRRCLYPAAVAETMTLPSLGVSVLVMAAFAALLFGWCVRAAGRYEVTQ